MRNAVKCNNCETENPFYRLNCISCNSILRNRIVNIDLWKTAWGLIDAPIKTFNKIIQSEHKNFILFLTLVASLKYLVLSILIINGFKLKRDFISGSFLVNFGIIIIGFVLFLVLFSFLIKIFGNLFQLKTRFKDNYTILIYAHLPQLILFPLLFVIEFAVFGNYWISFNPPPYIIKPGIAYAMIGIETLTIIGTIILSILAIYSQSKLKIFSLLIGLVFNTLLYVIILILSLFLFV